MDKIEISKETAEDIVALLRQLRECRRDMLHGWRYENDRRVLDVLVDLDRAQLAAKVK